VCLADTPFVDPYSDTSRGVAAVPLPPKDVLSANSVDSVLSNDRDPIQSVLMTDHIKGGGDASKKINFSTLCYVVLLVIIACNAVVCSWHVMKAERKEMIMGYLKGGRITAKMSETDVSDTDSDSQMEEEDYYDRDDDDEYRSSSDVLDDDEL